MPPEPDPQPQPEPLSTLAERLLPLHGATVVAQFADYSQPSIFHEPALGALLKTVARGDLEQEPLITLVAPESGRAQYRAGDEYRFELIAAQPAAHKLPALLLGLLDSQRLAPADPRVPFGRQFRVQRFLDPADGEVLQGAQAVPFYGNRHLQLELAFWRAEPHVRVRLQSPLRILRDFDDRADSKGEARFVADADELQTAFCARLWGSLVHLAKHVGIALPAAPAAPQASAADAFFVDWDYRSSAASSKPMGGLLGWLDLDLRNAHPDWYLALLLSQRLGLGQRRSFGWGRFRLESPQGRGTAPRRQRLRNVLQRAVAPDNVREALAHAIGARDAPPELSHLSASDLRNGHSLPAASRQTLDEAIALLQEGRYPAPDLHGHVLFADSGKARPLAVPPWLDRTVQRAVHQVLGSDLETLMNDASFGFRRGRSRFDVKRHVQSLYREGYRWHFEADITAFFDNVPHDRLHTRLAALLGDDPVVAAAMQWMAAPVQFMQRRIERTRGLPQGAPLSPLMANLVLEDLDADFARAGLRLLRYADDFVVLCKSRDDAERAHDIAHEALADIGLSLKAAKTRVGHLGSEGLEFLGFRFLGDLVTDRSRPKTGARPPLRVPEASWLAELLQREPALWPVVERRYLGLPEPPDLAARAPVVATDAPLAGHTLAERPSVIAGSAPLASADTASAIAPHTSDEPVRSDHPQPATTSEPADLEWQDEGEALPTSEAAEAHPDEGQWLCLLDDALIAQRQGRLCVLTQANGGHDFAWNQLDGVLVYGHTRLTSGAVHAALDNGVPLHFMGGPDGYRGSLANPRRDLDDLDQALRQRSRFAEPEFALDLARALVTARIHNQRESVRQRLRQSPQLPAIQADLAALQQQAALASQRDRLNGYEGQASHRYLQALATCLLPPFEFAARNRRPPRDPVNALLSLGYTVLYTRTAGLIQAEGLHPRIGFYHQPHGRHATLASDLMEPFRHVVERSVWTLINRREVSLEDFHTSEATGCRLSPRAKRLYFARLAEAFARRQTTADDEHGNWFELMRRQLRSLRAAIDASGPAWFYRMR